MRNNIIQISQTIFSHLLLWTFVYFITNELIKRGYISKFTIPPTEEIIFDFIHLFKNEIVPKGFYHHVFITFIEFFIAGIILLATFFLFVLILFSVKLKTLGSVITYFYAIPSIILYPPLLLLFGFGIEPKIAMGILVGSAPLYFYTAAAIASSNPDVFKLGFIYTNSKFKLLLKIWIPSVLPILITGIRFGLIYCFVGILFSEMTAGGEGLGFLISWSSTTLRIATMYSIIITVIIFALIIYLIGLAVEKRVLGRGALS